MATFDTGTDDTTTGRDRFAFQGRSPTRIGVRVNGLFVLPWIFVFPAFFGTAFHMVANLAAFGLMLAAAWLTREGIKAEVAFEARTVASRPAVPRKLLGAAAMGLGLAAAVLARGTVAEAGLLGALATGLHVLSFGPDPLRHKGITTEDFQSTRVARAVDNAEAELDAMTTAIAGLRDPALSERVARFQITARDMFRTVEQDPSDLTAARKYLGVYLMGAREASEKFAALYDRSGDAQDRAAFVTLLDDLERNFAARTQTLLHNDRAALDIEIAVLRERLERDASHFPGIRT